MVKKVKLTITTVPAADVVLAALGKAEELEERLPTCWWPDEFQSLGAVLAGASEQIVQEGRSIAETFAAVCDEIEDVEFNGPEEIEEPEDLEQRWILDCNLMNASTEGLEELKALVEEVNESNWFWLGDIQLGRQSGEIDELVGVVDEHLEQREEADDDEPNDEAVGSSGSWGDGDFSNPGPRAGTPVDAGPDVTFYFYHEVTLANLPHPRSLDEAKRHWKALTPRLHPDRNPHPDATERFRRFNDGYEALRRRLGGE